MVCGPLYCPLGSDLTAASEQTWYAYASWEEPGAGVGWGGVVNVAFHSPRTDTKAQGWNGLCKVEISLGFQGQSDLGSMPHAAGLYKCCHGVGLHTWS